MALRALQVLALAFRPQYSVWWVTSVYQRVLNTAHLLAQTHLAESQTKDTVNVVTRSAYGALIIIVGWMQTGLKGLAAALELIHFAA